MRAKLFTAYQRYGSTKALLVFLGIVASASHSRKQRKMTAIFIIWNCA